MLEAKNGGESDDSEQSEGNQRIELPSQQSARMMAAQKAGRVLVQEMDSPDNAEDEQGQDEEVHEGQEEGEDDGRGREEEDANNADKNISNVTCSREDDAEIQNEKEMTKRSSVEGDDYAISRCSYKRSDARETDRFVRESSSAIKTKRRKI